MTPCLLCAVPEPIWKGIYSKRREFAFQADLYFLIEGRPLVTLDAKHSDGVAYLAGVFIPHYISF